MPLNGVRQPFRKMPPWGQPADLLPGLLVARSVAQVMSRSVGHVAQPFLSPAKGLRSSRAAFNTFFAPTPPPRCRASPIRPSRKRASEMARPASSTNSPIPHIFAPAINRRPATLQEIGDHQGMNFRKLVRAVRIWRAKRRSGPGSERLEVGPGSRIPGGLPGRVG